MGDEPYPDMYRAIAETSVNPFAIIDDDGVFRWVGESIEELLGWKPDELVGRSMRGHRGPSLAGRRHRRLRRARRPAAPHRLPAGGVGQAADLVCRDGTTTPCNLMAASRSQTGLPYHLVFARRAGYEHALDNALEAIASHADMDDVLGHLVATLQQSIPTLRRRHRRRLAGRPLQR